MYTYEGNSNLLKETTDNYYTKIYYQENKSIRLIKRLESIFKQIYTYTYTLSLEVKVYSYHIFTHAKCQKSRFENVSCYIGICIYCVGISINHDVYAKWLICMPLLTFWSFWLTFLICVFLCCLFF
jgi:hypothetical protein